MPLTDFAIKRLTPKDKPYRVSDGRGLALLVHTNGSRYWQFRYRFDGKGKLLALGVYPEITLAEARDRCHEARKQVAAGIDPSEVRKVRKTAKVIMLLNAEFSDADRDKLDEQIVLAALWDIQANLEMAQAFLRRLDIKPS